MVTFNLYRGLIVNNLQVSDIKRNMVICIICLLYLYNPWLYVKPCLDNPQFLQVILHSACSLPQQEIEMCCFIIRRILLAKALIRKSMCIKMFQIWKEIIKNLLKWSYYVYFVLALLFSFICSVPHIYRLPSNIYIFSLSGKNNLRHYWGNILRNMDSIKNIRGFCS